MLPSREVRSARPEEDPDRAVPSCGASNPPRERMVYLVPPAYPCEDERATIAATPPGYLLEAIDWPCCRGAGDRGRQGDVTRRPDRPLIVVGRHIGRQLQLLQIQRLDGGRTGGKSPDRGGGFVAGCGDWRGRAMGTAHAPILWIVGGCRHEKARKAGAGSAHHPDRAG
jgi:hypothetical protein